MNTNQLSEFFPAALKCALTMISTAAVAVTVAAQTNTFPSSGSAGVGTTTPNSTLTVVGNVGVEANSGFTSGVGLLGLDSGNSYLQLYDSTRTMRTYFSSRAGVNSYINNGNVGIGTTNPQWGRLQVNKIIRIDDDSASPTGSDTLMGAPMLYLGTSTGGNAFQFNSGGGLDLWQYNAGWGRAVTFTKTGNVGIGTTTPGRRLEILAPDGEAVRAYRNANNAGWGVNMVFALNNSSSQQRDYAGVHGLIQSSAAGSEQGTLILSTATTGTLTEKFRIDSSGKVGIGLSAPLYSLDVNGGVNAFRAKASTSSGSDAIATFENSSGISAIIRGNGNVGIGVTSPNYKLDVNGEINATGIRINGTPISSGGGSSQWGGTSGNPIYYNGGNVGIGTPSPSTRLHVSAGDSSVALFGPNPTWNGSLAVGAGADLLVPIANRGQVLASNGNLHLDAGIGQNVYIGWLNASNTILNGQGGNVGIATSNPTEKLEVNGSIKVSGAGNITAAGTIEGGNIKAKYQDLAEWVPSAEQLPAGTVVVLDATKSNQVISSTVGYDTRVAGVISAQPGITLGEGGEGKVLVATTGRVRVKVDASRAPIQIGDLLVTSDIPGVAMKSEAVNLGGVQIHRPGTIIGKALEPQAKGQGEILVLLSLQ